LGSSAADAKESIEESDDEELPDKSALISVPTPKQDTGYGHHVVYDKSIIGFMPDQLEIGEEDKSFRAYTYIPVHYVIKDPPAMLKRIEMGLASMCWGSITAVELSQYKSEINIGVFFPRNPDTSTWIRLLEHIDKRMEMRNELLDDPESPANVAVYKPFLRQAENNKGVSFFFRVPVYKSGIPKADFGCFSVTPNSNATQRCNFTHLRIGTKAQVTVHVAGMIKAMDKAMTMRRRLKLDGKQVILELQPGRLDGQETVFFNADA